MKDESRSGSSHILAHRIRWEVTDKSPRKQHRLRDIFCSGTHDASESYSHHRHYLWIQNSGNRRWIDEKYPLSRQARGWTRERENDGEGVEGGKFIRFNQSKKWA